MVKRTSPIVSLIPFIAASIAYVAYLCKALPIVGTMHNFNLLRQACLPLVGAFFGVYGATFSAFAKILLHTCITQSIVVPLAHVGLATYAASLYWAVERRWLRCGIPLTCFVLFVVHPIGSQAVAYAALWIIPLVIAAFNLRMPLALSLASTFTAHAVGSVIHLYTVNPLSPAQWHMLIPVALAERCMIACSMYIGYMLVQYVRTHVRAVGLSFGYKALQQQEN